MKFLVYAQYLPTYMYIHMYKMGEVVITFLDSDDIELVYVACYVHAAQFDGCTAI